MTLTDKASRNFHCTESKREPLFQLARERIEEVARKALEMQVWTAAANDQNDYINEDGMVRENALHSDELEALKNAFVPKTDVLAMVADEARKPAAV